MGNGGNGGNGGENIKWPENDKGTLLCDVCIEKGFDGLFLTMQGGHNHFRKTIEKLNKHQGYQTTGWKGNEAELNTVSEEALTSVSNLKAGMVRESSFNAPGGMGKVYFTKEHSTLVEFVAGKSALVESYVTTKAPYGDKFHVMLRHRMTSVDKTWTRLEVRCTIVYNGSVNGMIKGMIEKGSREGMRKTNDNVLQVLRETMTVKEKAGQEPLTKKRTLVQFHFLKRDDLQTIFGARMIAVLEPWACLVSEFLEHLPLMNIFTPSRIVFLFLITVSLELTRILVSILGALKRGSEIPEANPVGYGLHFFFKVFHVPGSTHEVVCSVLFLCFLRWILSLVSLMLPVPEVGESQQQNQKVHGVKYDGYNRAMSNVSAQYVGIDGSSQFALDQIAKGMDYVAKKLNVEHKEDRLKMRESLRQKISKHHQKHKEKKQKRMEARDESQPSSPQTDSSTSTELECGSKEKEIVFSATGYQSPELQQDILEKTVVEEVFESERHQPFRGFGSTWPGHFLPTDRVHKWNVRKANSNGIYSSQDISVVAPSLPDGWVWAEDSWTLDLSGIPSHTTDNDGWSYATDFPKDIIFPFPPGSGKVNISKFVRTRRWLRTRIPRHVLASRNIESNTESNVHSSLHVNEPKTDEATSSTVVSEQQ